MEGQSDTNALEIKAAQSKVRNSLEIICLVFVALSLIGCLIGIVVAVTGSEDTDASTSTKTIEADAIDSISIVSYTHPFNCSTSIVERPRALRAAQHDGTTLLYFGSASSADLAFVLIDDDSDGLVANGSFSSPR